MPYKDVAMKRARAAAWMKSPAAARTPLAREVEAVIAASETPIGPTAIRDALKRSTTIDCVSNTLTRLHREGHIRSVGRGQWVRA